MKDDIGELWDMLLAYVRQETVDPFKGLARYVAFGIAGSSVLTIGLAMLVLGVLRLVQGETGSALTGHLSWIPYLCAGAVTVVVAAMAAAGILRAKKEEDHVPRVIENRATRGDSR